MVRESFSLTYEELRRFCPGGQRDILNGLALHSSLLEDYGLAANTLRLCHFLAQAAHETAGFRTLVEYGSTSYFRDLYGHRRDLGNLKRTDGSRFRGRGIFQLTGRSNYRLYGQFLGVDLEANPLLAKSPELSLRIACEYWRRHDLSQYADVNDIGTITKRINGGFNGLSDRKRYLERAMSIWMPDAIPSISLPILRIGDRGPAVMRLQKHLQLLGLRLVIDGLFGRQTRRALIKFQRRTQLRPDGLFGPLSRQALHQIISQSAEAIPVPSGTNPSIKPKETYMDQWKSYLSSRAIWANIIGFVALALDMFGYNGVSAEDQSQIIDQVLKLVEAGGFIAGVVFRAIARDRLGPTLI